MHDVDVVIVGAGFAGMYTLVTTRRLGLSARVIEAGSDVGGTWYWNRYPGARCDVESLDYCYGFSPELLQDWTWSERFATQPEILRYIDHVADRFDLRSDIEFDTRVTSASFDEARARWTIGTDAGAAYSARFCVMATGCLSLSYVPPFEGLDEFEGQLLHTGRWPHEPVDFSGRRVGVIGTGSSGMQLVPEVAKEAAELYVFQRTPNFSLPARNAPIPAELLAERRADPGYRRAALLTDAGSAIRFPAIGDAAVAAPADERDSEFERRWSIGGIVLMRSYRDLLVDERSNELLGDFVRRKIREIVADPAVAEMLVPTDHHIGTKRICVDTDYYATFNRDNVTLVDVRHDPIERLTSTGLETKERSFELDTVVFATGYDAMTGVLLNIDIRGRRGSTLSDSWRDGPETYLGLAVHGFPNLFLVTGPGSPSVRADMITAIEQHVEWIAGCLTYLETNGLTQIEATPEAQSLWVRHVAEVADSTLFGTSSSWYSGDNIEGKPRVFAPYVGGLDVYVRECDEVARDGYRGFSLS